MKNFMQLISIFLVVAVISQNAQADLIPVKVEIDNVSMGEITANLNKKREAVAVNGVQLVNLLNPFVQADKISRIKTLIDADENITLENLARVSITSSYAEKDFKLVLVVPLEMRVVKDFPVLVTKNNTGLVLYDKDYSGFLNIKGLFGYSDQSTPTLYSYQTSPIQGQFELVQNLNFFTFESTATYKEYEATPFQRYDTSLVHDFEKQRIRLRIGDFYSGIQGFQSSLAGGGIQFQKQFNIYPDKGAVNRKSTSLQIKKNSLLEVFINNILVLRTRVNAGPYNLKDLPLLYGQNRVKIILRDDFGGVEEFVVDLLFDDQILAKGVNDFSYQVGKPSYFLLNEKKYYPDNFSSFFHKYGLTDETTLFFNHQNYQSSNLFGIGAGFLTPFGTNFIDLGHYEDSTVTSANAARWHYNSPELSLKYFDRFRLFGGAEFRSIGFNTITPTVPLVSIFSEKYDFIVQKQLTDLSSLSLGYTRIRGQGVGPDDVNRRFVYQNKFAANWRFDLAYNWSQQQPDLDQVLLTLNWIESEGRAQAAFSHDTVDKNTTVRVTKNSRVNYNDLQIDMFASKQRPRATAIDSQNVDLSANYYAAKYESRFQISGNSVGSDFSSAGQFGFGTALAWTTDSFSFSRPITDSFAVVEAQDLGPGQHLTIPNGFEKDSIILENNENFVFANLTSYSQRALRLDSTNLGASNHLDREAYLLNPKYRSGLFVPLKVIKSLTVRGKLISDKKDQVNYAYGKILTEDGKVFTNNFFTDEAGNFVVNGLSYGKYQIVLADPRIKKIGFELENSGESERAKEKGKPEDPDASEYELGTLKIEKEAGT